MMRWKTWWPDLAEDLPVDVMPQSNGEYIPPPPTMRQRAIMQLADAETERMRRRFNMSRRDFVRTAAATAIGFWAIDMVSDRQWGSYAHGHVTDPTDGCDLQYAGATGAMALANLPGEFIFDVQSHHVDPQGLWRWNNPGFQAAFAVLWPQSSALLGPRPGIHTDGGNVTVHGGGAGEIDPIENLSRFHYVKEILLDSSTNMTVLSAVPTAPDERQPLPIGEAVETVQIVNNLAGAPNGAERSVMHAFVMPNRGSAGNNTEGYGLRPVFLDEELDLMTARAAAHPFIRGWKVYCPWGDIPNASGWFLDSQDVGAPFLQHVLDTSAANPQIPPVVATHKGFALPSFDQRSAAPRDIGPAAAAFPGVRFIVYHSGHDINEGPQTPYPEATEDSIPDDQRSVNAFIKTLRKHGVDGPSNGGNSPNVWAEIGATWRDYMGSPSSATHLLGKLIKYVGPERVVWGTDSLWFGSPQSQIAALRTLTFSQQACALYGLSSAGLDSDVDDPTQAAPTPARTIRNAIFGRNAAAAYSTASHVIDPDATRNAIACDQIGSLREGYLEDVGTLRERAPLASHQSPGPRTRRELFTLKRSQPWGP